MHPIVQFKYKSMEKNSQMSFFRENFRLKKMKRKVSWFMLLFLVCFQPGKVFAQDQKVTLDFVNAKVEDVFSEINRQTGMGFVYNRTQLQTINPVTVQVENVTVNEALAQLLKDSGLTEKETREAIAELRKGSKVNSQSAEDSYDALGRYAINLNERARAGKLDPVIGRDDEIRRGNGCRRALCDECQSG